MILVEESKLGGVWMSGGGGTSFWGFSGKCWCIDDVMMDHVWLIMYVWLDNKIFVYMLFVKISIYIGRWYVYIFINR